jgi:23S rRNA pseudouridine1911/1915/1917 synthase
MALDLQLNGDWVARFVGVDAPLAREDELPQWIVYEDEHVLVLNKPGWLVCHPSKQGPYSSLVGAAKEYLGSDIGHLVSRLDRETSGLVLIAKNRYAASNYQKAIEQRRVQKAYWVWVHGKLEGAVEVNQPLAKDLESPVHVKQTVRKSNSAQKAVTRFEGVCYSQAADLSLVRAEPVTGRKHQIRAHLRWLGYPVFGDKLYGPDDRLYLEFIEAGWTDRLQQALVFPRQALHAASLEFEGIPLRCRFDAPLTEDLVELNRAAGLSLPEV